MQTAFLQAPLAKKLLRDNLIVIFTISLLALLSFLLVSAYVAQKDLRATSIYQANTLAANLDDNLDDADLRPARKLILNTSFAPDVLGITVYDKKGSPKISWDSVEYFGKVENLSSIPVPNNSTVHAQTSLRRDYLDVLVPMANGTTTTGFLQMHISLNSFYKDFALHLVLGLLALAVATLTAAYLLTQRQISRLAPVFELSRIVEQVSVTGDYSLRAHHHDSNELGSLSQHFNKIMSHIESWESVVQIEADERLVEEQRMTILDNHDSLTKLPNRHYFHRLLTSSVEHAVESQQLAALAFIDIDHFRALNDLYGYDAGDLILATMANRLCAVLRNTDTLCRVDGDEFAAIFPDIGSIEMAQILADRLVQAVQEPLILRGKKLTITASVGVACCPLHGKEQRLYLHNTDLALKEAKYSGTNTWRIFSATTAQADAQLALQVNI